VSLGLLYNRREQVTKSILPHNLGRELPEIEIRALVKQCKRQLVTQIIFVGNYALSSIILVI
jgi:hypothetical protein